MELSHKCCKCTRTMYAIYKGKYYCPTHLEEKLAEEKRLLANKAKPRD